MLHSPRITGWYQLLSQKSCLMVNMALTGISEVAQAVWSEVFFCLAQNNVLFEGILLKPSMVTPGAECKERATPEQVADYTLKLLQRRVPPAVPGIMFLSGGQSEVEATLNLNAMKQSPNPWHVSFSYARAFRTPA